MQAEAPDELRGVKGCQVRGPVRTAPVPGVLGVDSPMLTLYFVVRGQLNESETSCARRSAAC
jgi:hypothetical protein